MIRADSMPIRATVSRRPPGRRLLVSARRDCSAAGSWMENRSTIDSANSTISALAPSTTAGCCSQTVSSEPVSPATTPTAV